MSFDRLFDEMRAEHRKWAVATRIYGTLYVGIRVFLIIASSIVAADDRLRNSPAVFLVGWISVLAVTVSALTALDTWIKPRDKWRGFMADRDDLSDLLIRVQANQQAAPALLDGLRDEFARLRRRHRDTNVY